MHAIFAFLLPSEMIQDVKDDMIIRNCPKICQIILDYINLYIVANCLHCTGLFYLFIYLYLCLLGTHADGSRGGWVFTGVCSFVCLSVFSARYLKTRCI